jgi:predicted RecA/RadA family phage recombinase
MSLSSSTTYIFTVCAAASAVLTPPVPVANPNISSFCFVAPAITTSASGTQDISASLNPSAVVIGPRAPTTIQLLATAGALTAGIPVKADTSNARGVVSTATGDTGGGIALGILVNSPASGGVATIMTSGLTNLPVLGTSTCAIGQFVVVDTTTNGRVKCTTYTAGTSLGVALAAQSTVGGNVQMIVQIR